MGWRRDWLAVGLVRGAVRHYCLGGCSALVVCARRSRPVRGVWAGAGCCVFPVSPFPPHVFCAVCGAPSRPGVPYPRSLVRHSKRSVCCAGSVRLPCWYSPRVLCVYVCSRSRGVRAPPTPRVGVGRAPRAVPVLSAGRAVPRIPCPSACPALVLCSVSLSGGPVPYPPYLAWGCALSVGRVCASGAFQRRGGGGLCAVFPGGAAGGARGAGGRLTSVCPSAFPGQATKRVSLASLWPWRAWPPYCSGSCSLTVPGRGPCGVLVRWRGFACPSRFLREQAAGGVEAGPAAPPPPPGTAVLPVGEETVPSALGGVGGRRPHGPRVGGGEWGEGGGSRRGSPPPSPDPPFVAGASPPGVRVRPGSWGSPGRHARPAAGGSAWRGGGRAASAPPSPDEWPGGLVGQGVALPRSVPLPSLGGQQSGCHWRRSGHGGRGPHTAPVRVHVQPPGPVRVSSLCAGAGSPACCAPRGSRRWGAWGRAVCGLSCVPSRVPRPL